MKKYIILVVLAFLLFGCNENSIDPTISTKTTSEEIIQVNINNREHGYNNFTTTIIDSSENLEIFLSNIELQEGWNDKSYFISELQSNIDFDKYNLVLFRVTEASGSIVVTANEPTIEDEKLIINITRDIPDIGTADEAHYCFAYLINKTFTEVTFIVEDKETVELKL